MMVIVDKEQDSIMSFGEIEVGEVFRYNNSLYLKIDLHSRDGVNAYDFSEGELDYFHVDRMVQAVNATLTIEPW